MNLQPRKRNKTYLRPNPEGLEYRTHVGRHFIILVSVMILGTILALLVTRNLTSNASSMQSELAQINDNMYSDVKTHFGGVVAESIALSESLTMEIAIELSEAGTSFEELKKDPVLLSRILDRETDRLILALERANCSGVFFILDATINPNAPNSETSRAGIYIRRVEPKRIGNQSEILFMRGPTQFALKRGMTLQANWDLEFNVDGLDFWALPLRASEGTEKQPLMNLYYWSFEAIIPENNDTSLLCSVPLLDAQGSTLGVCGLEITESNFRYLHQPSASSSGGIALLFSALEGDSLDMTTGLLSGSHDVETSLCGIPNMDMEPNGENFTRFLSGSFSFRGLCRELPLYTETSKFYEQKFALACIVSEDVYNRELQADLIRIVAIIAAMFILGLALTFVISKRLARPVNAALESMQNVEQTAPVLTVGVKELDEVLRLYAERNPGQVTQIGEMLAGFVEKINTLTPTERVIVSYYWDGKTIEEVRQSLFIAASTIKTHNIHIYKKLNISGLDELRLYLEMVQKSPVAAELAQMLKSQ